VSDGPEGVEGTEDLKDVFGAGLLLVEPGGRRAGMAGSGGAGFRVEDILVPEGLACPN
jgi:hypothetical protein